MSGSGRAWVQSRCYELEVGEGILRNVVERAPGDRARYFASLNARMAEWIARARPQLDGVFEAWQWPSGTVDAGPRLHLRVCGGSARFKLAPFPALDPARLPILEAELGAILEAHRKPPAPVAPMPPPFPHPPTLWQRLRRWLSPRPREASP